VTRAASSLQVPGAERQGLGILGKLGKLGVVVKLTDLDFTTDVSPVYIPSGNLT
jgi:hypothetical protein